MSSQRYAPAFVICIMLLFSGKLRAQSPTGGETRAVPIPVEFMGGNNRFTLQTLVNKKFTPDSRFSLLSVTSAASAYSNQSGNFDFINTSEIGFELYRGIGLTTGISLNAKTGFSPTAGIEYVYTGHTWLFVLAPGLYLSNDHNWETISVLEYKPVFDKSWSLYTRLQLLYNYNLGQAHHDRSYIDGRIGPAYKQFAFGAGANFDWYGPTKAYKSNYGLFVRYSFL